MMAGVSAGRVLALVAAVLCLSSARAAGDDNSTLAPTMAPTNPMGTLTAFGGDLDMTYTVLDNGAVQVQVSYPMTSGWIGVGLSDNGDMVGSYAVIAGQGVSGIPAPIGEYKLTAYDAPSLSSSRAITDTSIEVNNGIMTMEFTATTIAGRSLDVSGDGDRIIYAVYEGSSFGTQHARAGDSTVNWSSPVPSSAVRLAPLGLILLGALVNVIMI
ncbi:Hypothetical Protein FCC1311_057582 [Hondaea fermentalgiana]|uniref:DOMON domain-containing protein n=1 Tax=Hondaea fermentalgiana TaxID=2315210 RepID=A0A2R5GF68_9STRA|nr:Hypothetical Protein FCC1311_057582 [Hondaea fermentalgiana]|eukprot:GBG29537.1 Hypothetical Protein FCC1311_057582 [Hondaea fermentalgiana]